MKANFQCHYDFDQKMGLYLIIKAHLSFTESVILLFCIALSEMKFLSQFSQEQTLGL